MVKSLRETLGLCVNSEGILSAIPRWPFSQYSDFIWIYHETSFQVDRYYCSLSGCRGNFICGLQYDLNLSVTIHRIHFNLGIT